MCDCGDSLCTYEAFRFDVENNDTDGILIALDTSTSEEYGCLFRHLKNGEAVFFAASCDMWESTFATVLTAALASGADIDAWALLRKAIESNAVNAIAYIRDCVVCLKEAASGVAVRYVALCAEYDHVRELSYALHLRTDSFWIATAKLYEHKSSLILHCARYGATACMRHILHRHLAPLDDVDCMGYGLIHIAAQQGYWHVIRFLLTETDVRWDEPVATPSASQDNDSCRSEETDLSLFDIYAPPICVPANASAIAHATSHGHMVEWVYSMFDPSWMLFVCHVLMPKLDTTRDAVGSLHRFCLSRERLWEPCILQKIAAFCSFSVFGSASQDPNSE